MTLIRKRAPYIVLVIVLASGAWVMNTNQNETSSTAKKVDAQQHQLERQQHQLAHQQARLKYSKEENDYTTCLKINKVQDRIVAFADSTRKRSLTNLKAVLASSTSTPEMKIAALKNYAGIVIIKKQLRASLKNEKCKPPSTPDPDISS